MCLGERNTRNDFRSLGVQTPRSKRIKLLVSGTHGIQESREKAPGPKDMGVAKYDMPPIPRLKGSEDYDAICDMWHDVTL